MKRLLAALVMSAVLAPLAARADDRKTEGVVNIRGAFNALEEIKDFTTVLEAEKKVQVVELEKVEKEVKEKEKMRDTEGISQKLRIQIQTEIVQLQAKYDFLVKAWNEVIKARLDEGVAQVYNKIVAEVAEYAKANGLWIVYKVEDGPVTIGDGPAIDAKIAQRGVIYVDPAYDITAKIVETLNEKYAKDKAAKKDPAKDPQPVGDPPK
jgi:Skp family chaperone for outer membrane proteins